MAKIDKFVKFVKLAAACSDNKQGRVRAQPTSPATPPKSLHNREKIKT